MSATKFVSPANLIKATELIKEYVQAVAASTDFEAMTEQEVETAISGVLNEIEE